MSNETPPNEEEVSEASTVVEAPSSSSRNSSPPCTPRNSRKQLSPLFGPPTTLSPSSFVKRKNKYLNISTMNHNHEQSLPMMLPSPTDTVQTSDTCPLDLSLELEEDLHVHIIHNLDEEEHNLGGNPLDSPARRSAILTARRFQHWKDHSHAVGLAPVSWLEEWQEEYELMTTQTRTVAAAAATDNDTNQDAQEPSHSNWKEVMQLYGSNPSLLIFTRFQRVGNMVILMERKDWMQLSTRDDCAVPIGLSEEGNDNFNSNGNENTTEATSTSCPCPSRRFTTTETRYTMVLGPYWSTLFCFTLPLITTLSIITATNAIFIPANLNSSEPSGCWIIAIWTTLTLLLYLSLLYTSLVDPGILPRCEERPIKSYSGNWRWNDQAQSYIPPDAVYEPDCKVVIEGYHHTCVYTGTAIGKNNTWSFGAFVVLGFACLFMDVVLLSIMM